MNNYEYKLLNTAAKGLMGGKVDLQSMSVELNQLGQDGWELIEIISSNQDFGSTRYIISVFKREIQ